MLESVKLPEVRQSLSEFFKGITQPVKIMNRESFVLLGWACAAFLDNVPIRETNEEGLSQLESIMSISMVIYM